jgi:hypothetical protein
LVLIKILFINILYNVIVYCLFWINGESDEIKMKHIYIYIYIVVL